MAKFNILTRSQNMLSMGCLAIMIISYFTYHLEHPIYQVQPSGPQKLHRAPSSKLAPALWSAISFKFLKWQFGEITLHQYKVYYTHVRVK